ncbi:hypothetical protein SCG7109_AI_00050 [Chlamydiales bacterium SCGC AG-110-M15]|nr:hypothetical protein SCG7109_AI_00050 [Chlamydiales bacterium SCGC AG-110-M15]
MRDLKKRGGYTLLSIQLTTFSGFKLENNHFLTYNLSNL